jgi:hypothetical protein
MADAAEEMRDTGSFSSLRGPSRVREWMGG